MATMDLNLLRTFLSIYETRSLTTTAKELLVTQPSVSHSLARLRTQFDDPLFLRKRQGMQPTNTATELYEAFKGSVARIDMTIDSTGHFDPATSSRRFRLCLTDVGEMTLLPSILARMATQAPSTELEVVPMEIELVPEWLALGTVDAAIASAPIAGGLHSTAVLMEDSYVCLMREDHPITGDQITIEEFVSARHAIVTQATGHRLAEKAIADLGITRNSSLVLHHFSVLPHVIAKCGLIAIVPLGVADSFVGRWPVKVMDLPFHVPSFEVRLHWQARDRVSPAISWFHEMIVESLR